MKKMGNAGHGQESYDPKTGKFIADGHQNKYFPNPNEEHKIAEGIPAKKISDASAAGMKSPVGNLGDYAKPSAGGETGSASADWESKTYKDYDVDDFSWAENYTGDKEAFGKRFRKQMRDKDEKEFDERTEALTKLFGIDIKANWDEIKDSLEDVSGYEWDDENVFITLEQAMSKNELQDLIKRHGGKYRY